jgi:hypothetical protein
MIILPKINQINHLINNLIINFVHYILKLLKLSIYLIHQTNTIKSKIMEQKTKFYSTAHVLDSKSNNQPTKPHPPPPDNNPNPLQSPQLTKTLSHTHPNPNPKNRTL